MYVGFWDDKLRREKKESERGKENGGVECKGGLWWIEEVIGWSGYGKATIPYNERKGVFSSREAFFPLKYYYILSPRKNHPQVRSICVL